MEQFVNHYYEHPDALRLAQILEYFKSHGALSEKAQYGSLQGLFGGLLSNNPDFVGEFVDSIQDGKFDESSNISLSMALWFCATEECREALGDNPFQIPDEFFQETQNFRPKPLVEMPIYGPSEIDILWGWFTATGDSAAVKRILTYVLENEKKVSKASRAGTKDLSVITAGAARRTLESQARKHGRVAEVLSECAVKNRVCKDILAEAARQAQTTTSRGTNTR